MSTALGHHRPCPSAALFALLTLGLPGMVRGEGGPPARPGAGPVRTEATPPALPQAGPPDPSLRPTSDSAVESVRLLFEAIARIGDGQLVEAVSLLTPFTGDPALQRNGHRPEALYYKGLALRRGGLPLLAGRAQAEVVRGEDPGLARRAARQLVRLEQDHPGALSLYDGLAGASPSELLFPAEMRAGLKLARARELLRQGREEQAEALLVSIPRGGPVGVRALLLRSAHLARRRDPQALSLLLPLLTAPRPDEAAGKGDLHLAAARLAQGLGQADQALRQLQQIAPDHPRHREALFHLAWTLQAQGRAEEAWEHLRRLIGCPPGASGCRPDAALPPGSWPLAARIALQACAPQLAGRLLDRGEDQLIRELELLGPAGPGSAQELLAVSKPEQEKESRGQPGEALRVLLLHPEDRPLLDLRRALAQEGRQLETGRTPVRWSSSPVGPGLIREHQALRRRLEQRIAAALEQRARHRRESTLAWLRLVLTLRHELLLQQRNSPEPGEPPAGGRKLEELRFGACPLDP